MDRAPDEGLRTARPLGVSTAVLRARALAAMFAAGASVALLALAFPGADVVEHVPWVLNASVGFPVAAALWLWGRRFPDVLVHAGLVVGAVVVALGMTFGNGTSLTVAAAFFFIWVALYVSLFFSREAAAAHIAFDTVLMAIAFAVSDVPAAGAVTLMITVTAVIVGIVTGATRAQLARLAVTDQLTGLPNRHALYGALAAETARSQRTSIPYTVAMLDLDRFKAVNDEQGHHAGDTLLAASARAWQECLRPTDVLVRYGGDEFVAVLPACDDADAAILSSRLRSSAPGPCSIGTATWQPGDEQNAVLERADQNLYLSKRRGGNTITTQGCQHL